MAIAAEIEAQSAAIVAANAQDVAEGRAEDAAGGKAVLSAFSLTEVPDPKMNAEKSPVKGGTPAKAG